MIKEERIGGHSRKRSKIVSPEGRKVQIDVKNEMETAVSGEKQQKKRQPSIE